MAGWGRSALDISLQAAERQRMHDAISEPLFEDNHKNTDSRPFPQVSIAKKVSDSPKWAHFDSKLSVAAQGSRSLIPLHRGTVRPDHESSPVHTIRSR